MRRAPPRRVPSTASRSVSLVVVPLPLAAQRTGHAVSGDRKSLWKSPSSCPSCNRDLAPSDHGEGEELKPPRLPPTLAVHRHESVHPRLQPFEDGAIGWSQWQNLHRGQNLAVKAKSTLPKCSHFSSQWRTGLRSPLCSFIPSRKSKSQDTPEAFEAHPALVLQPYDLTASIACHSLRLE